MTVAVRMAKFLSQSAGVRFSILLMWAMQWCVFAFATPPPDSPQVFTYQGQFLNAAGTAPLNDTLDLMTFGIYSPAVDCLLYEESQATFDLVASGGLFAVQIGSVVGDFSKRTNPRDPGLTMAAVFSNAAAAGRTAGANCTSGYTPLSGDKRVLQVTVTPHSTGIPVILTPNQIIGSVPQAIVAETLQGYSVNQLLFNTSPNQTITGNITITGNLTVSGTINGGSGGSRVLQVPPA